MMLRCFLGYKFRKAVRPTFNHASYIGTTQARNELNAVQMPL